MHWPHYIACFFAGVFLVNTVPHFVKGICGERYTTPFAKPPGRGLSSPLVNILWALFNLVVGYVLVRVGRVAVLATHEVIVLLVGVAAMSIAMSAGEDSKGNTPKIGTASIS